MIKGHTESNSNVFFWHGKYKLPCCFCDSVDYLFMVQDFPKIRLPTREFCIGAQPNATYSVFKSSGGNSWRTFVPMGGGGQLNATEDWRKNFSQKSIAILSPICQSAALASIIHLTSFPQLISFLQCLFIFVHHYPISFFWHYVVVSLCCVICLYCACLWFRLLIFIEGFVSLLVSFFLSCFIWIFLFICLEIHPSRNPNPGFNPGYNPNPGFNRAPVLPIRLRNMLRGFYSRSALLFSVDWFIQFSG